MKNLLFQSSVMARVELDQFTSLSLSHYTFYPEVYQRFLAVLPLCPRLASLNLCNTRLGQMDLRLLAEALTARQAPPIATLEMCRNGLHGADTAQILAGLLPRMPCLNELTLTDNGFEDAEIAAIYDALWQCHRLTKVAFVRAPLDEAISRHHQRLEVLGSRLWTTILGSRRKRLPRLPAYIWQQLYVEELLASPPDALEDLIDLTPPEQPAACVIS